MSLYFHRFVSSWDQQEAFVQAGATFIFVPEHQAFANVCVIPRQLLLLMFLVLSRWRSSVVIGRAGLNPQIGTNSYVAAGHNGQAGRGIVSVRCYCRDMAHRFGLSRYN
jgi:hypothetical protein